MAVAWNGKQGREMREALVRAVADAMPPYGRKWSAQNEQDRNQLRGMWYDHRVRPERLEGWRGHRLWHEHFVIAAMEGLRTKSKRLTVKTISAASNRTPKQVTKSLNKLKALGMVDSDDGKWTILASLP